MQEAIELSEIEIDSIRNSVKKIEETYKIAMILKKYAQSGEKVNSFSSLDYSLIPDADFMIEELVSKGYLTQKKNIADTISLTDFALSEFEELKKREDLSI